MRKDVRSLLLAPTVALLIGCRSPDPKTRELGAVTAQTSRGEAVVAEPRLQTHRSPNSDGWPVYRYPSLPAEYRSPVSVVSLPREPMSENAVHTWASSALGAPRYFRAVSQRPRAEWLCVLGVSTTSGLVAWDILLFALPLPDPTVGHRSWQLVLVAPARMTAESTQDPLRMEIQEEPLRVVFFSRKGDTMATVPLGDTLLPQSVGRGREE